jgi:hypothetical protein
MMRPRCDVPRALRVVFRLIVVAAGFPGLAMIACGTSYDSVLDTKLASGQQIRDLVPGDSLTAVLIYQPAMCYSCSPMFARWESLQRDGRIALVLIMDTPPDEGEARALKIARIPVKGVLAHPFRSATPSELLIRYGTVIDSAEGAMQVSEAQLWTHLAVGGQPAARSRGLR